MGDQEVNLSPITGTPPALEIRDLTKSFGGVPALFGVNLEIESGKIHALVGANGSGKSTIVKSLSGYHETVDSGSVLIGGNVHGLPLSGALAKKLGLHFVHQDLGLVDQMTVLDNVCLYAGYPISRGVKIDQRQARLYTARLLGALGIDVSPESILESLGPTERVMVAVARATVSDRGTGILILDEPTAAVPITDAARILKVVRDLRDAGWAILYISHHLDEVLDVANAITVIRDGRVVANFERSQIDSVKLADAVIGSNSANDELGGMLQPPGVARPVGDIVLRLDGISGKRLHDIELVIREGEVVGLTGPTGSGKSELARIIAGAARPREGFVELDGTRRDFRTPLDAINAGVGYVPQDRLKHAMLAKASVRENISGLFLKPFVSRWLHLSRRLELEGARAMIHRFNVQPGDPEREVSTLSGGNQQKTVFARASRVASRVLVLDDPTAGVDIGARRQIQEIIRDIATNLAVVVLSTDLDELIALCDRIVILRHGAMSAEFTAPISHDELARAVFAGDRATLSAASSGEQE